MQSLVGVLGLKPHVVCIFDIFLQLWVFLSFGLDVLGKKHRRNRDRMRTGTRVKRGLEKENRRNKQKKKSTVEIEKRTGIRIERGLEYGLNIDQKSNIWKEEAEKSTPEILPLYHY
jgi:hypothetical protein